MAAIPERNPDRGGRGHGRSDATLLAAVAVLILAGLLEIAIGAVDNDGVGGIPGVVIQLSWVAAGLMTARLLMTLDRDQLRRVSSAGWLLLLAPLSMTTLRLPVFGSDYTEVAHLLAELATLGAVVALADVLAADRRRGPNAAVRRVGEPALVALAAGAALSLHQANASLVFAFAAVATLARALARRPIRLIPFAVGAAVVGVIALGTWYMRDYQLMRLQYLLDGWAHPRLPMLYLGSDSILGSLRSAWSS